MGLILFAGVLVTALIAVIKSRRKPEEQSNPLTAALGGALIFMAGHAAVEVVFSFYSHLPGFRRIWPDCSVLRPNHAPVLCKGGGAEGYGLGAGGVAADLYHPAGL